MRIAYTVSDSVRRAISAIGRTEDIQYSPDGKNLAIAGFSTDKVLLLDVDPTAGQGELGFADYLLIACASFAQPHGLAWIDNRTIVVASRKGDVAILRLPEQRPAAREIDVLPLATIRQDHIGLLNSPGSVAVADLGSGLLEVLICNNWKHYISRHVLDTRANYAPLANQMLIRAGLNVPDGVARSPSGRWLAITSHHDHLTYLYRNGASLGVASKPEGRLIGVTYPHGVRFTRDGQYMLVADAGNPFISVFFSADGEWAGERAPLTAIRVVDDETFARGHHSPEEGGPKGLDLSPDGHTMAVTCEEEPLAFFDVRDILIANSARGNGQDGDSDEWRRLLRDSRTAQSAAELRSQQLQAQLRDLQRSRSWRVTRPLRWASTTLRGR